MGLDALVDERLALAEEHQHADGVEDGQARTAPRASASPRASPRPSACRRRRRRRSCASCATRRRRRRARWRGRRRRGAGRAGPARRRCQAVQAPKTPAPTTMVSHVSAARVGAAVAAWLACGWRRRRASSDSGRGHGQSARRALDQLATGEASPASLGHARLLVSAGRTLALAAEIDSGTGPSLLSVNRVSRVVLFIFKRALFRTRVLAREIDSRICPLRQPRFKRAGASGARLARVGARARRIAWRATLLAAVRAVSEPRKSP